MDIHPMISASRWTVGAVVCMAAALIAWAYWPGLAGPFLFDDYGNLDEIGAFGPPDRWPGLLYYLTSGQADPTGRPVALLSFLLDAREWPAEPWPFKRTNLVLHLLNTALLAWVVTRLQAGAQQRQPRLQTSAWTPVVAAALWGAHPFFVSTTLYVVQREAMLPMTFVLLALLAWDRTVQQFVRGRPHAAWAWAIVGMGGATVLAGLSKANGFLTPLLVGLAYCWFLRPADNAAGSTQRRRMDTAAAICLGLPSLLLLAYLLLVAWQTWSLPQLTARDWSLPERLLSQPRALWSYVAQLALPRAGGGGVYVDDFAASRGWLDPVTTLPAILALAASVVAAVRLRVRFPIACFSWLFFLAAHLLESSVIGLELYFEHRNYLPALFLGWPIAHALSRPGVYRVPRASLLAVVAAGLLLLTHQRALVWGDPALLGALSAQHQKESPRAQVYAARQEFGRRDMRAGLARIHMALRRYPDSADVAISAIGLECRGTGALSVDTMARARHALATANEWNYGLYDWLQNASRNEGLRGCEGFGLAGMAALVTAAETNPQTRNAPTRMRDLRHVRGRIALAEGRPDVALHWFDAALRLKPDPQYALVQAAALGEAGAPALGVQHLDQYQRIEAGKPPEKVRDMATAHAWLLWHDGYYRKQLSYLRGRLEVAAKDATASASHG
jgi:tetratricopeptide (TPR) repeat protein